MDNLEHTRQRLENTRTKELFGQLYGKNNGIISSQIKRYNAIAKEYITLFPEDRDEIQLFSTSGRTEVGGNHTDHNAGRVLAAAVNFDSVAAAIKNDSDTIVIYSEGFPDAFTVNLIDLAPSKEEQETTTALIRGIAARFKDLGYNIGGFNCYISSTVMKGSGLSSSASIEVLIGTVLSALYNHGSIDPMELAMIGQYAENVYFGKPSGLMDQMACAVGGFVNIDFRDNTNPIVKKVEFDLTEQGYHLLVIDTGGNHADLTNDYADVPKEMRTVAQVLGKKVLRQLTIEDIIQNIPLLREKAGDRAVLRAMHFFADDNRVVEQVKALEEKRFKDFLSLVNESGSSSWRLLQNCYTNQNPGEQGVTLALAITEKFIMEKGEGACRVHGGGFAGTIQAYIPDIYLSEYIGLIQGIFGEKAVTVLNIRPFGTLHLNCLLD